MANTNLNLVKYNGFGCYISALATTFSIMNDGVSSTALPAYASGEALEVISDDTDDDGSPAGNGARTVTVIYIDTDGSIDSETVTMNGTTAVALTDTTVARVLDAYVATAGTSGTNEGNISVRTVSGSNVRLRIPPLHSRAAPGRFTVPTGMIGLYRGFNVSNSTVTNLTDVTYLVEADISPLTGSLNENVYVPIDWASSGPASGVVGNCVPMEKGARRVYLPEKATVRIRAIATGATGAKAGGFVFVELHPKPTT